MSKIRKNIEYWRLTSDIAGDFDGAQTQASGLIYDTYRYPTFRIDSGGDAENRLTFTDPDTNHQFIHQCKDNRFTIFYNDTSSWTTKVYIGSQVRIYETLSLSGVGSMNKIVNLANGVNPNDGVNFSQLDTKLNKSGNNNYTGGTLTFSTADIDMDGNNIDMGTTGRIENLQDPDSDDDAISKGYADGRYTRQVHSGGGRIGAFSETIGGYAMDAMDEQSGGYVGLNCPIAGSGAYTDWTSTSIDMADYGVPADADGVILRSWCKIYAEHTEAVGKVYMYVNDPTGVYAPYALMTCTTVGTSASGINPNIISHAQIGDFYARTVGGYTINNYSITYRLQNDHTSLTNRLIRAYMATWVVGYYYN